MNALKYFMPGWLLFALFGCTSEHLIENDYHLPVKIRPNILALKQHKRYSEKDTFFLNQDKKYTLLNRVYYQSSAIDGSFERTLRITVLNDTLFKINRILYYPKDSSFVKVEYGIISVWRWDYVIRGSKMKGRLNFNKTEQDKINADLNLMPIKTLNANTKGILFIH